ncbi:MAG: hypothetical protein IJE28_01545 [Oscillospiraceae bacterium]|nr:hypothetical protein [Oscillospiraceae bacterium]
MDMDLLIELAVRAVKAYLEKEGVVAAVPAPVEPRKALVLTEEHCGETCSIENYGSELCKVDCALAQNYEVNVDDYDVVVLRSMTNSNLFKIANGCTDNKFLALAAEAILKGKRVIMVKECVEILKYAETAPKALYNNIYKNLQILLDSGVELAPEENVKTALTDGIEVPAEVPAVPAPAAVKEEAPAPAPKAESDDSVLVLTKRVVTERDIKAAAAQHYTKIQLPEKPVITYLAKDTAFELGIELL